ncbi:MAG: serine kinase [Spirochaetota bacterium]
MKLSEIVERLDLQVHCCEGRLDQEISRGYASDLMSDVIARAQEGDLWVTLQVHVNVVAVGVMKGLSGVVFVNGREPEPDTLARARDEGLPLLTSGLPAFELIGRLYALGVRGARR